MLCPNCTHYTWRQVQGSCESCTAPTANQYTKLCANCSINLDECEVCRTHMGTKSTPSTKSSQSGWTIKKKQTDNGGSVTLKVGDKLEVTLDEQRMKEWFTGTAYTSEICEDKRGDFQQDPQQWNQGWRTLTYEAKNAGTCTLTIEEWQMKYDHGGGWGYTYRLVKDKLLNTWTMKVTVK